MQKPNESKQNKQKTYEHLSDEDDNSWQDELSNSEDEHNDEYYGEEDYGDETASPTQINESMQNQEENTSIDKKRALDKIVMNVYCTEYDVVRKVAKRVMNFKLKEIKEDHDGGIHKGQGGGKLNPCWDITWHDLAISPDFMTKMEPYQKVNHFPGMYVVCRKNLLARNLKKMQRAYPEEYNFFPKTWLLPSELTEFRQYFQPNGKSKPNKKTTYIVKPEALSQGKGIFLTRSLDEILDNCQNEGCVVQKYVNKPYLIEDLKFDLRIYVLLYGVNPLRIYLHHMGLARFATETYSNPAKSNLDNLYMHLTNYAINKYNSKFQQNEDEDEDDAGHKRSLGAILNLLRDEGHDPETLLEGIKDIIVKTMVIGQPYLSHLYRSCQPDDLDNAMCFQVLGFDILIDQKGKPLLLEVNQSPSFGTDSPLDYKIKKCVLGDAFNLLNVSYEKRQEHIRVKREEMEKRIFSGKTQKFGGEEREKLRQEKLQERYEFEKTRMGGYELIFPSPDEVKNKKYEEYIQKANFLWDEFTTGNKSKKFKEQQVDNAGKKPQLQRNLSKQMTQGTLNQQTQKKTIEQTQPIVKSTLKLNNPPSIVQSTSTSSRAKQEPIIIPKAAIKEDRLLNKTIDAIQEQMTPVTDGKSLTQDTAVNSTTSRQQKRYPTEVQITPPREPKLQQKSGSKIDVNHSKTSLIIKEMQQARAQEKNQEQQRQQMKSVNQSQHLKAASVYSNNPEPIKPQPYQSNQNTNLKSTYQSSQQQAFSQYINVAQQYLSINHSSYSTIDKRVTPTLGDSQKIKLQPNADLNRNKQIPMNLFQLLHNNGIQYDPNMPLPNISTANNIQVVQQQNPVLANGQHQRKSVSRVIHLTQNQMNSYQQIAQLMGAQDSPTSKKQPLPMLNNNSIGSQASKTLAKQSTYPYVLKEDQPNQRAPSSSSLKKGQNHQNGLYHSPQVVNNKQVLSYGQVGNRTRQSGYHIQGRQMSNVIYQNNNTMGQGPLVVSNKIVRVPINSTSIGKQISQVEAINGKSLMPKLFDFCSLEDMCAKKQSQNQRDLEEALMQLERQKQQKLGFAPGLIKRN